MAKNILKKSLALGVLMTFLITGSVWAAETPITGEITSTSIVIGSADVKKPSSADNNKPVSNVVAMGKDITYSDGSNNLVLLGKDVEANGNRLVYIGSNINKPPSSDDIKEAITNYLANLDSSTPSNDNNNVAIGSIINITGKNSVAIGMGVNVEANNAIAIGSGSAVAEGENGTVSFGRGEAGSNNEITRTLTHVSAGTKTTDAINKGQLDAEALIRANKDYDLEVAIQNEANTRYNEDERLQQNINVNSEKLQHITADADGTYIEGTTYFNKDTDNQVIINQNGIKVGLNSVHIDSLDVSIEDRKSVV